MMGRISRRSPFFLLSSPLATVAQDSPRLDTLYPRTRKTLPTKQRGRIYSMSSPNYSVWETELPGLPRTYPNTAWKRTRGKSNSDLI